MSNEKINSQKKCTKFFLSIHDLIAAEGLYHNKFKQELYSGSPTNTGIPGQSNNLIRNKNFNAVCEWLEVEPEIHTLSNIYKKMLDIAGFEECAHSQ